MSHPQPSDAELIAAHLQGSATALMQLWMRYDGLVYGVAFSFVRGRDAAEDLRQEVFLKMYQHLATLQEVEKFPGWLHRITTNTCHTWLHRQRMTIPFETLPDHEQPTVPFASDLEQREQDAALRRMIGQLALEYRTVIELHYFEGQHISAIASFLALPEATVKWRLYKARTLLRQAAQLEAAADTGAAYP